MTPRPGDRVRITCEGVVDRVGETGTFLATLDNADIGRTPFTAAEQSASTFSMEVIPRALEVGDRVHHRNDWTGTIVFVPSKGASAAVEWDVSGTTSMHALSDLKPLEPSSPFQGQGEGK